MATSADGERTTERQRLREEADRLYEQYGKLLEEEHWGEFVAISKDGRTLLGPTVRDVLREAEEAFGPGNYMFKLGPRAVGRL